MKTAFIIGLDLDRFWLMTPWQFSLAVEGWNKQREMQRDSDLFLAWHSAAFQRAKKMPKLSKILEKPKPKQKMSGDEIKQTFKALMKSK